VTVCQWSLSLPPAAHTCCGVHHLTFINYFIRTGDKYDINVVDLWSSSSPWPLCNMPKSYFFLVKHPWLWRMSFRCSEPELLHEAMFTVRPILISVSRHLGALSWLSHASPADADVSLLDTASLCAGLHCDSW
jgi:hypothetical protein